MDRDRRASDRGESGAVVLALSAMLLVGLTLVTVQIWRVATAGSVAADAARAGARAGAESVVRRGDRPPRRRCGLGADRRPRRSLGGGGRHGSTLRLRDRGRQRRRVRHRIALRRTPRRGHRPTQRHRADRPPPAAGVEGAGDVRSVTRDDRGSAMLLVPIAVLVLLPRRRTRDGHLPLGRGAAAPRDGIRGDRRRPRGRRTRSNGVPRRGHGFASRPNPHSPNWRRSGSPAQGLAGSAEVVRVDDRTVEVTLRSTVEPWLSPGGPWAVHATAMGVLEVRPPN